MGKATKRTLRTLAAISLLALLAGCLRPSSSGGGVTVIAPLALPTNAALTPQLTVRVLPTRPLPILGTPAAGTEEANLYITPAGSLGPIALSPMTETPTPYYSPTPSPTIPPTLPSPGDRCTYTVKGGDSLFAIALQYDTTVSEIQAQNPSQEDDSLYPGDVLWLPNCDPSLSEAELTATAIATNADIPTSTPTLAPQIAARHTVAAGDNLFQISLTYGVTMDAIIELNQLEDPDALSIGQVLLIPSADGP
jgi:LysM repeat protein